MIHKVEQLLEKLDEIDAVINESVKGWKTSRMAKVDLTLLRLAVYEIRYEEDVPQGVAINEAVELAKKYGTDDSASFVNGVLAKIV
jgi:N utilization substance protein B